MKKIVLILMVSFLARLSFVQEDTTIVYPVDHYIGMDMMGVANTFFRGLLIILSHQDFQLFL